MRKILLIFTFLLLSLNSFSQKWLEVTKDKSGNKYYIKSSYVSKDGNIIKIWTKQILVKIKDGTGKPGTKGKVYYNPYVIELIEYDCKNLYSKLYSRTVYTSDGSVIADSKINAEYADLEYIVPDSTEEKILTKVCETYN